MNKKLTIKIALEPLFILRELQNNGFEAYIVGGAVRDTIVDAEDNAHNLSASDYDFTTNAKPEEIQMVFPENFYENEFGTISVTKTHLQEQMGILIKKDDDDDGGGGNDVDNDDEAKKTKPKTSGTNFETSPVANNKTINLNEATKIHQSLMDSEEIKASVKQNNPKKTTDSKEEVFEITTFRSDGEYKNHRKPEDVVWGDTLESDLSRRDFTINAMAIKFSKEFLATIDFTKAKELMDVNSDNFEIVDLHGGMNDLKYQIIKTVGNPNKRFNEDALRLLRAIRFSVQLNMQIDDETYEAIIKNANLIEHISGERIRDEFLKMIKSDYPKEAIEILDKTGLLKTIIPELLEGKMIMQGGHHVSDVWTHSLNALAECPSKDPIIRLATLLHDIAKPRTLKIVDDKPTFYNHEIIGSRMAKNITKRLRLSGDEIERVFILVRYHMFHYQPENSDASIRRFMKKVGLENINDILDVREADRLGSGARKSSWRLEEMKQRMIEQLHQPFSVSDLEIDGNDLMKELDLKPGKIIGEILNDLFEKVLDNPELNSKEQLLENAKKFTPNS